MCRRVISGSFSERWSIRAYTVTVRTTIFMFPPRVVIRDVDTMEPVGYGKAGLVNLISPLVESIPLVSILTDDLGVLHRGCECGCGIEAPYLEIIGRTGVPEIRTCAAGAEEVLKEAGRSALR